MDEQVARPITQAPNRQRTPQQGGRRRRTLPWVLSLIVLVVVGVILWRHPWTMQAGSASGKRHAFGDAPQAVGVGTVHAGDVPMLMGGLGTVTPLATVTVRTQINGILQTVAFAEGQMVHRGDFLAQIDARPYQALLEQAQGALARDQALLREARLDLGRYTTLNQQDSISRQQMDTQDSLVHQYLGDVITDQAAIATQRINLAYCHIVAPVDGRIGLRQVDAGNYVTTTDANGIVVITQLQPISVIFTLPEDDLPPIQRQLAAGARLTVTAWDRANTMQLSSGMLATLDNQIDTATGTVKLRATFANADGMLFPNQFVNAKLLVDTLRGATLVPNAAVQTGSPGTFVYVVRPDHTVGIQVIKTGAADTADTAAVSGLRVGDVVVTDGTDRLKEGSKVVLPGQAADAGAPTGANVGTPHHHRHQAPATPPADSQN